MTLVNRGKANRLLGYQDDARLLIINADDFGMCHAVNESVLRAFENGVLCSTTLMVPCPWSLHAMHFLARHAEIPFGIHLTAVSEWTDYRWGSLTSKENVPTLIDRAGYFYDFEHMPQFLAQVNLVELETEFRAQIEAVLAMGLKPTHLDWHALRIGRREDIFELMLKLAREYGLALRVARRSRIQKLQEKGLPTNDYDFLDSYLLKPKEKSESFVRMLRELPAGLSEWAVHPAVESAELLAIEPGSNHTRQADFEFLISPIARNIIEEEGIILLDYLALQQAWREASSIL